MFKNFCVNLLLLQLLSLHYSSQVSKNTLSSWQLKPAYNQGFILIHRATIGHLVRGYPGIYELNISRPTYGNKLWHLENNKPDIGISLQCIDFKNPSQLGYAFTASPYLEIPLNQTEKKSRLIMRLCWGATYLNKSFDIKTNPKNIAIGSHINSFVQFKWFWHLKLNKSLRFEPGITFTHASNGKFKNPNLGLNVLSLNAGLNYFVPSSSREIKTHVDSSTRVKSKNELFAFTAIGFNQNSINGPTLKSYVYSIGYQRNVRNTHKFSAGIDLYYDENYFVDYENQFNTPVTGFEKMRISARIGYSYNVGRVSFPIEMGYYAYQKYSPDAIVVSRIGVRYYSPIGLVGHFGLRTHFAVAYDFEFGVGYRFFLK